MTRHLSPRQISEWMIGERSGENSEHVRECAACRAQVDGLDSTLAGFRGSVRHWSERELDNTKLGQLGSHIAGTRAGLARLGWMAVAVAVFLLAVLIAPHAPPKSPSNGDVAIADAALLKRVDSELSRAVPSPMEPLTRLVSWDPGGAQREAQ